uniref:hypothetical protein n=1 Tax=Algoriphagus locisalis TaxID=305507 RepID=UPI00147EE60D|nr:hypothetical protein [Algoriphagus locisalis]
MPRLSMDKGVCTKPFFGVINMVAIPMEESRIVTGTDLVNMLVSPTVSFSQR